jgi:class 3 adenylate cyclase
MSHQRMTGDDAVDLFRRLTHSRLGDRGRVLRAGINRVILEQTLKKSLKTGATLIRLRQQGEDELLHRGSILVEAAKELLAGSPISTLEANARACKSITETIISSSYAEIWQCISDVDYVRELLTFKVNTAAALQWHLADIRNQQIDRAATEVDLLVRSRLANRPPPIPEKSRRRLAAIVAIDVVGYSARMEKDEDRAAAEILELYALAGTGRVFNTAGDGIMLEFPSATDAVLAGEALRDRSNVPIKVGIHLAEVSGEGDLLAHAVNVAARLMQEAQPNQVLVSSDVRRLIRGKLRNLMWDSRTVRMKNMEEEIEAFPLDQIRD